MHSIALRLTNLYSWQKIRSNDNLVNNSRCCCYHISNCDRLGGDVLSWDFCGDVSNHDHEFVIGYRLEKMFTGIDAVHWFLLGRGRINKIFIHLFTRRYWIFRVDGQKNTTDDMVHARMVVSCPSFHAQRLAGNR